jgi:hypothetical protein
MANNISNKLVVRGTNAKQIEDFLKAIEGNVNEDNRKEFIDFDRIITMPEDFVNTEESTKSSDSLYYFLMTTNKEGLVSKYVSYPQFKSIDDFANKTKDELAEYMEMGEKIYKLILKYGFTSWYDWRLYNWGVKWNAYDSYIEECEGGVLVMYFYTPWNAPIPVMQKLVEMFPHLTFEYKYADEDMAYNCGEGVGEDGCLSINRPKGGSDEAMGIYVECWNEEWSNFKKTDNGWTYNWGDDDYDWNESDESAYLS